MKKQNRRLTLRTDTIRLLDAPDRAAGGVLTSTCSQALGCTVTHTPTCATCNPGCISNAGTC